MSDILFLTSAAPPKSPFTTKEKRPPLGVGTLMSILREDGHNVHFMDRYLDPSKDPIRYLSHYSDIKFVGIHSNTICSRDTMKLIHDIDALRKNGSWNGKILVGGPHTTVTQDFPEVVDYVVIGEAEKVICDIIDGASWVDERFIRTKRLTSEELNDLPFQPWDIFASLPYDLSCPWIDANPVFTMNTSRGCPFNCSFCSSDTLWNGKHTKFGAERMVDEIKFLVDNYGAKGIYFREDNFTIDSKRLMRFCDLIEKEGIDITWACETRVSNLKRSTIRRMANVGCGAFYFGIESGSPKILKMVNKKINVKQIESVIKTSKEFGIRSYCSLVTGLPGETKKDYLMTERLMARLKPYAYTYNIFVGLPYSDLYRESIEEGYHEFIDDIGLLYMPGYDVKTRFFYGMESTEFVDHEFDISLRSDYDKFLLRRNRTKKIQTAWKLLKQKISREQGV